MNEYQNSTDESESFQALITELFQNYHSPTTLSSFELSKGALITSILLAGDERLSQTRGVAIQSTLEWILKKLAEGNSHEQISYRFLQSRYLERKKWLVYKEEEHIELPAVSKRQRKAIERAANILCEEVKWLEDTIERKTMFTEKRYSECLDKEQKILRTLSILNTAVSIEDLIKICGFPIKQPASLLRQRNLIWFGEDWISVQIHPEIREFVAAKLAYHYDEKKASHKLAARMYERKNMFVESAKHWLNSGKPEKAADILIRARHRFGSKELPISGLKDLLEKLFKQELDINRWGRLKLISGRLREVTGETVEEAVREFRQALALKDILVKAEAHFGIGRAYRQTQPEEARENYKLCREFLAEDSSIEGDQLLARSYISEAWIDFEQTQNFNLAWENLLKGEQIINTHKQEVKWYPLLVDLHGAKSQWHAQQNQTTDEIYHSKQAWFYASHSPYQDIEQLFNTAYNLGTTCCWEKKYEEARERFETSMQYAVESGNKRKEAMSYKGFGYYYFFIGEYLTAVKHYEKMYEYCKQSNHLIWLASACYDLAEAYVYAGRILDARKFYREGIKVSQETQNIRVGGELSQLFNEFRELEVDLREEQLKALWFIRKERQVTNGRYQEITGVDRDKARHHLNELVEKGFLKQVGHTKGTIYKPEVSLPYTF